MKIFLDTADTGVIARHFNTGLVDGVTTNPTLIMKSGKDPEEVYKEIEKIGVQDISMEVMGNWTEMLEEGTRLSQKFGDVATIKIPCTHDGLMACRYLSQDGIRTNVTLIFSAAQAVLAAKAGATYVSPFVGRLDDQSVAGLEVVRSIAGLYQVQGVKTQVLSASIRSVQRAVRSWYNGAEVVTMPPSIFEDMYKHMLTDKGMEIFEKDWAEVSKPKFDPNTMWTGA
jgi:transaldolase